MSDNAVDNRVFFTLHGEPRVEHAYCVKYLRSILNHLPLVVQRSDSGKPKNISHDKYIAGVEKLEEFFSRPRYWDPTKVEKNVSSNNS